jgi:hypothetical protein
LSFALALISPGTGLVRPALPLISSGTGLVWQLFDLPGFPAVWLTRLTSSRWLSIAF